MNLKVMNRYVLLLMGLLWVSAAAAQVDSYQYKADLNEVSQDGFYKIALTPAITGRCHNTAYGDVRIVHNGQQVPYLQEHGMVMPVHKAVFPVITRSIDTARQFYVIFENAGQVLLDHLLLDIENADIVRALTLSGSDNNTDWYAIREDFNWNLSGENQKSITFPVVHYRYLKLVFNGSGKLPVNVLHAQTLTPGAGEQSYMLLPTPAITQKDSNRSSYLTLKFDHKYKVSKLELTASGPKYFYCAATVSTFSGKYENGYASVNLSSGTQTITLDVPHAEEIKVIISNEDSPPIHIDGVRAFQDAQYVTAYLERGKSYQLVFGDSTATAPVYDLGFFKDSIGRKIPELGIGAIEATKQGKAVTASSASDNKWLLWSVLIILLAGLSLVTFKMVRKIGATES